MKPARLLQPGTLWPAVRNQTVHALACGALQPIACVERTIEDGGVRFAVRRVSSLKRKGAHKPGGAANAGANPFLPHDPDLFVADITDTHFALLNKFNVIDHHLLIVTRAFARQEALLDAADFAAWLACLAEFDGLGFYNSCPDAGASQPHKHLQIVPLPLDASGSRLPIEPLFAAAPPPGTVGTVPGLPFRHAFARLDPAPGPSPDAALAAVDRYRALLDAAGLHAVDVNGEAHGSAPYNLLITPDWMLLVPRSAPDVEGVSVNALGFAGSLFVRDAAQMAVIERLGPFSVLRRVALAADPAR